MKIKLKSTLYFDFCFVSKLIWSKEIAIEIRKYTKVPDKEKNSVQKLYNTMRTKITVL